MKDDYTTNSHYLTHTFLFRKVGRMYFLNLGAKGLKYETKPKKAERKIRSTALQISARCVWQLWLATSKILFDFRCRWRYWGSGRVFFFSFIAQRPSPSTAFPTWRKIQYNVIFRFVAEQRCELIANESPPLELWRLRLRSVYRGIAHSPRASDIL